MAVFSRRRSRRTTIASLNGRIAEVGKVASPRGTKPWLMPRRADDAHIAAAAAAMQSTLSDMGWNVSTGPLVWNRRREDLGSERQSDGVPVIWAADLDGGRLHQDASRDSHRWLQLRDGETRVMVLDAPAVLVQRTTAPEQQRRLVCVPLSQEILDQWGGRVVIENHVNVIRSSSESLLPPALSLGALAAFLSTRTADRLTRCISGSVALSAFELEAFPLPEESTVSGWETLRGDDLEQAVAAAYQPANR